MQDELSSNGLFSIGFWLQSINQFEKATRCYEKVINETPEFYQAYFNLGVVSYYQNGDPTKAIEYFAKTITIQPDLAEAWSAIGIIRCDQNRFSEALVCLDQALAIDPTLTTAHYHMGVALQKNGRYQEGIQSFRKAMANDPTFAPARWLSLLSLPILYDNPEQIDYYRRQFISNMATLVNSIELRTPRQKQYALTGIRTCTNFYLQYQGRNDLDLQTQYGRLVHRVMSANYPQWAQTKPMSSVRRVCRPAWTISMLAPSRAKIGLMT